MRLLLDTNLLRRLCHPTNDGDVKAWFERVLAYAALHPETALYVSAVADYELRRGYHWKLERHTDEQRGLARLDQLCNELGVRAVSNEAFKDAALLWAQARKGGYSTAPEDRPDWDAVLAAQARELNAIVITTNTKHLRRYGIDAKDWYEVPVPASEQ
ncbi:MAG: PIN domain-containing protein [Phycisphaeraceae bacterium]|nr:PIN domain-containing protein [Phycisphaeraceae bacterium]